MCPAPGSNRLRGQPRASRNGSPAAKASPRASCTSTRAPPQLSRASKAASILAVGVTAVEGDFERDDLVRILSPDGAQLAVGRISCDSGTARRNIGRKGLKPLVHCDYLYME